MDLNTISSWTTIGMAAAACGGWLIGLAKWIFKKQREANELAKQGELVADELVSAATSPARRADIYMLVTIMMIDFSARRTRSVILLLAAAGFTVILPIFFVFLGRFLVVIDYSSPYIISMYITYTGLVISLGFVHWSEFMLRRMEAGWKCGVRKAIDEKLSKHFP